MPLVDREILEWVDGLLQVGGGVCAAALLIAFVRRRIQDPLFLQATPAPQAPRIEHLLLLVAQFLLPAAVVLAVFPAGPVAAPGSSHWHVMNAVSGAESLAVAAAVAVVLHQRPTFATPVDRSIRSNGIAVVYCVLIAFFLCFPQLKAAKDIWHAVSSTTTQPTHVVIEAILHSEWGGWGVVQLVVSAVIVAPFTEELLVRGLLLGVLFHGTGLAWFSIIVSAAFFGFMHYPQPQDVAPLVTFGILLGVLRFRTQNLAVCMLVHGLFNLRTMALILLNPDMAT